jgi:amino acid permease
MMADDEVTSARNQITTGNKEKRDSISKEQGDTNQYGHNIDAEEKHTYGEVNQLPVLQRRLRSRHLQMIAIGERLYLSYGNFKHRVSGS